MKKIFFLLIMLLVLTFLGCTSTGTNKINYETKEKVYSPIKLALIVPNLTIDKKGNVTATSILISNITDKPLNILWEESSINNNVIFKSGMKYIDAGKTPPKTIIFPKGSEYLELYDSSTVYYQSGQYGGWRINKMRTPVKMILTIEQDGNKEQYISELNPQVKENIEN